MTTPIDVAADGAHDAEAPVQPEASYDYGQPAQAAAGRPVIATGLLTAHPGNVRRDIHLDQEFLDSIAELGILTPLRITPDGSGGYRVIEGHRRLAAGEQLGHAEVPYDLAAEREGDEAGQFLDMYAANHHRKGLSTLEEADALFAASANGASKRRIRKATGLSPDQVASALKAAGMSGLARETAAAFWQSITLDQAALFAEFADDDTAVTRIMTDICNGRTGQHVGERLRQERADEAARQQLTTQLAADGYEITDQCPGVRLLLTYLAHDGRDLTPETHAACPGRAVHLGSYNPPAVTHFCTDPAAHGHAPRSSGSALPDLSGSGATAYRSFAFSRPRKVHSGRKRSRSPSSGSGSARLAPHHSSASAAPRRNTSPGKVPFRGCSGASSLSSSKMSASRASPSSRARRAVTASPGVDWFLPGIARR
jgi:ParB family transcriptional regulator, chromosome partitioning protein